MANNQFAYHNVIGWEETFNEVSSLLYSCMCTFTNGSYSEGCIARKGVTENLAKSIQVDIFGYTSEFKLRQEEIHLCVEQKENLQ